MPGLFTRVKTWVKEHLKTTDLNAEFDSVITNSVPLKIDDLSLTVSDMQATDDPGDEGTENQAASLEEEVQQLRFQLKEIIGDAQWYSSPAASLGTAFTFQGIPQQRILSGRIDSFNQPMFLVPDGTLNRLYLRASTTPLVGFINGAYSIFDTDLVATDISLAATSDNTCLVNQYNLSGELYSKLMGEGETTIPIDTIGSAIVARDKTRAVFKLVHSASTEYFVADIDVANSCLKNVYRGHFFNSLDANQPRIAVSNNDTITLLNIGWAFALDESVQSLDVTYSQPVVSYDEPRDAEYWFDLASNTWKKNTAGTFSSVRALYLGIFASNTTACVVARSADFYRNHQIKNGIVLERAAADRVCVKGNGAEVWVYGKRINATGSTFYWDMDTQRDTGVTEAASTTYYFYISVTGKRVISDVPPVNRYGDLFGAYHPSKPYRCVGSAFNNSSSDFLSVIGSEFLQQKCAPYTSQNASVRFSIASNALSIQITALDGSDPSAVNPVFVSFPDSALTDTYHKTYRIEAPISYTIPSGQSLGQDAGYYQTCTILLGRQGSRILPIVCGVNVHNPVRSAHTLTSVDEVSVFAANTIRLYADVADSGSFFDGTAFLVAIAQFENFQSVPGTWATIPTSLVLNPQQNFGHPWYFGADPVFFPPSASLVLEGVSGSAPYGSASTKVRRFLDSYDGTYLQDRLSHILYAGVTAAAGTFFVPIRYGLFLFRYEDLRSGLNGTLGISRNGLGTTSVSSLPNSQRLAYCDTNSEHGGVSTMVRAGEFPIDAFLPHSHGNNDSASPKFFVTYFGDLSYRT